MSSASLSDHRISDEGILKAEGGKETNSCY